MPPAGAVHSWILLEDPLCLAPGTVIGLAFLALWWREQSARHHLWWGIASLLSAAGIALLDPAQSVSAELGWDTRLSSALVLLSSVAYLAGALAARGRAITPFAFGLGSAALALLILMLPAIPTPLRVLYYDSSVSLGLLGAAALVWPLGTFHRMASLLLALRALNLALLTGLIAGYEMIDRVRINQTLAFATGLLLIVGAFLRSVAELRELRGGLATRVAEATRDLSAAESELAVANTELEAFTYGVAHDLRAPLRSLDGYSRMLEEDCLDALDAEQRATLTVLRADAADVAALVDELLEVSRGLRAVQATPEGVRSVIDRLAARGDA